MKYKDDEIKKAKANCGSAMHLLERPELLDKIDGDDLCLIAKKHEPFAMSLLDRPELLDKIDGDDLCLIAKKHKPFAMSLLDRPELLDKIHDSDDLCRIAKKHEPFAMSLLDRSELLDKIDGDDFRRIAETHEQFAMRLLDRSELLDKIDVDDLYYIAKKHEPFAMSLFDRPELLDKIHDSDFWNITKKHEPFAMRLLGSPELFERLDNHTLRITAVSHESFAMALLEDHTVLLERMDHNDLCDVAKKHESFAIALLSTSEILALIDEADAISLINDRPKVAMAFLKTDISANFNTEIVQTIVQMLLNQYEGNQLEQLFDQVNDSDSYLPIALSILRGTSTPEDMQKIIDYLDRNNHLSDETIIALFQNIRNDQQLDKALDHFSEKLRMIDIDGNNFPMLVAQGLHSNNTKVLFKILEKSDFNINYQNISGQKLIDCIIALYDPSNQNTTDAIKELRYLGSLEPLTPTQLALSPKLDFTNDRLDSWEPNQKNIPMILKRLYEKYPLTNDQITHLIDEWKQRDFDTWLNKVWFDQHNILTIPQVIDSLIDLGQDVEDRIEIKWDFKKVLASIITCVSHDEESSIKLIHCLSELQMCSLGKLMNLLGVVQDQLMQSNQIDYTLKPLEYFYPVLNNAMHAIEAKFDDQSNNAINQWLKAILIREQPMEWSRDTQTIQGIMNRVFTQHLEKELATDNTDPRESIASYHYEYLANEIIPKRVEEMSFDTGDKHTEYYKSKIIDIFHANIYNYLSEALRKAVDDGVQLNFEDAFYNPLLNFGNFLCITYNDFDNLLSRYGYNEGCQEILSSNLSINDIAAQRLLGEDSIDYLLDFG